MNTEPVMPRHAEVWEVDFNPARGHEVQKIRPAIVLSADAIGRLPIKLVAPITGWQARFARNLWHIRLEPDSHNGLTKTSSVDTLQLRGMDHERFIRKLGYIVAPQMSEIRAAISLVIGA